jgi:hypothetical protein
VTTGLGPSRASAQSHEQQTAGSVLPGAPHIPMEKPAARHAATQPPGAQTLQSGSGATAVQEQHAPGSVDPGTPQYPVADPPSAVEQPRSQEPETHCEQSF